MGSEQVVTEYGPISSSFDSDKLADLCLPKVGVKTGPFGSQLHKRDYVESGTPIIAVEHLGENRIIHSDTPFVSDKDKERLSKYHLAQGDIVFSRVGSVDRRSIVRGDEDGWLFSGNCLRVRANKNKIHPEYLSYFFGYEGFKNHIRGIEVGATRPSINTKILSDIRIYYPDIYQQKAIAHVLGSLDDKIELNRRMNKTLESMAQALSKSWFVDFELNPGSIDKKIEFNKYEIQSLTKLRDTLLPKLLSGEVRIQDAAIRKNLGVLGYGE